MKTIKCSLSHLNNGAKIYIFGNTLGIKFNKSYDNYKLYNLENLCINNTISIVYNGTMYFYFDKYKFYGKVSDNKIQFKDKYKKEIHNKLFNKKFEEFIK